MARSGQVRQIRQLTRQTPTEEGRNTHTPTHPPTAHTSPLRCPSSFVCLLHHLARPPPFPQPLSAHSTHPSHVHTHTHRTQLHDLSTIFCRYAQAARQARQARQARHYAPYTHPSVRPSIDCIKHQALTTHRHRHGDMGSTQAAAA